MADEENPMRFDEKVALLTGVIPLGEPGHPDDTYFNGGVRK
jgi:hypothetical protein